MQRNKSLTKSLRSQTTRLSTNDDSKDFDGHVGGRRGKTAVKVKMDLANNISSSSSNANSEAKAPKRRRSSRGSIGGVRELAERIVKGDKVLFITGAGLSVDSGVRPFRSQTATRTTAVPTKNGLLPTAGLWNDVIWSTATRECFRKDPKKWYNEFWIPNFTTAANVVCKPNVGHLVIQELQKKYPNVKQITQNVDGLQPISDNMIEAHGRVGFYKCIPDEDSDTDSDSDDEPDRRVHLGHRRKSRIWKKNVAEPLTCPYQYLQSLTPCQIMPDDARAELLNLQPTTLLPTSPQCPVCGGNLLPQALLFDEGYHSHSFYRFEEAEKWIDECQAIVFVGTSFAVRLTTVALAHARDYEVPVFNFNLYDVLEANFRLDVTNIVGPCVETLPKLLDACKEARCCKSGDNKSVK